MSLAEFIKKKSIELENNNIAAGGVIGFYMTVLIGTIVVLSVVVPTVIDQVETLTECEGFVGGNCSNATPNITGSAATILDLFALMLALGLLMLYMRPLM